ncbi:uncharacterized protein LOC132304795 [Cornus florida]|uniref:uncharacterized protein LOC132304795 n=1 Tax=Cornus florida TaxID=4283 RepID=UPI00289A7876|nr:uncharacterized protein LOC132304795 [Cornus florida]
MAILKALQTLVKVEEDSDTEIEEILEECEKLAVKCNQQNSQIKKLSSEFLLKSQVNTQWSTKKCKEELFLILEERSLKMAEIWKQSTNGCLRHMIGDGSKFNSLKQFDGVNVIFGGNQRAKIVRIGTMSKFEELPEIQEVLLVEGLKHNLLSVSQLCDSGKEVCFNKERCNLIDLESKQDLFSANRSSENVCTVTEASQVT